MSRYGTGRFRLALKHPKTLSITSLFPTLLILGIPLLGALSFFLPALIYLFGASSLAYFGAILSSSISLAARYGWNYLFILPAVYLVIHAGLGWGFLRESVGELLRPRRKLG